MKRCHTCNTLGGDNQTACYVDGQPLVEDELATRLQEAIGEKYSLTRLIGKGAMGAVYGAYHRDLGDVAIKVMLAGRDSQTLSERFLREARALRKLRHQNTVLVYDLERSPSGVTYMVMEMVAGGSLGQDLRERQRFNLDETMEVAEAVCSALAAAHERGIIHRDLKPDNILRAEEQGHDGQLIRTIKIADFGIVKLRGGDDADMKITKSGKPIGTPFYMSPEQWFGDGPGLNALDHRTDIYALGCTLYELLAGRPPFIGRTPTEMRQQHLHEEPPPLHTLAPQVPLPFSRVIMRALTKDRDARQQTATEFLTELRAAYDESFQRTDQKMEEPLRSTQESWDEGANGAGAEPSSKLRDTEESVPLFAEKVMTLDLGLAPGLEELDEQVESAAFSSPAVVESIQPPPEEFAADVAGEIAEPAPADIAVIEDASHAIEQPSVMPVPTVTPPGKSQALIIPIVLLLVGAAVVIGVGLYLYLRRPAPITLENVQPPQSQFKPPQIPMSQLSGTLRVSAAPGSEIFVDDEKAGVTGADGIFSLQVPVGLRNVRVEAKNYRVWSRDVRVKSNEKTTLSAGRERPIEVEDATAEERQKRARAAEDKKDYDAAEAEYRALLKSDTDNAAAHARLGLLLNTQQRYAEAIDELETAVMLDAANTETRAVLVRLFLLKARDEDAERTARQLVKLSPRDAAAHHALARVLLRSPDKLNEALSEIETALKSRQAPEFLETKAYILLAGGSFDQALEVAQRAVEVDKSKTPPARAAVAVILFRMERVDEATAAYKELRQSDKSDRWGDGKRLEQRGYSKPVLQTLAALIARTN